MKLEERLIQLVNRLNTQDNRATGYPIFIVQQEHRVYGLQAGYSDKYIWMSKYEPEEAWETLEEARDSGYYDEGLTKDDFDKIYYIIEWHYVCAHFTEAAAQDYINANKHNLTNPRIYVESQHRCHEWIETIEILKRLGRAWNAGDHSIPDALNRQYAPVVVPDEEQP